MEEINRLREILEYYAGFNGTDREVMEIVEEIEKQRSLNNQEEK